MARLNSSRQRLYEENSLFAKSIPAGSVVLDAGAGDQRYKHLFAHTQYEAADFKKVDKKYAQPTYVCDLTDIPVEDARFDYILFNQVMEHLPNPQKVLTELFRVLKPGGRIIYTGPLFYEEHEKPYDFFRYTQFGLRMLFTDAGFVINRLDWMEGYYSTLGYQLKGMAKHLPMNPKEFGGGILGALSIPLVFAARISAYVLSVFFHRMEMRYKFTKRGYPKNYVAILTKPS